MPKPGKRLPGLGIQLVLRFGLMDGQPLMFAQVAALLGISRQGVHQLEVRALEYLRLHLGEVMKGVVKSSWCKI